MKEAFLESWNEEIYKEYFNEKTRFVQDNHSFSKKMSLRITLSNK